MLMMANHEPHDVTLGADVIHLERGQFIRTERNLGDKWGWSQKKVQTWLRVGTKQHLFSIKTESKGTVVTITNYERYQSSNGDKESKKNQKRIARESDGNQEKECKKEKNKYRDFVFLSDDEYEGLERDFGREVLESKIEDLDFYIGKNPKKRVKEYVDHNRTIRSWLKKDGVQKNTTTPYSKIQCPSCKTQYGPQEAVNGKCPVCGGQK